MKFRKVLIILIVAVFSLLEAGCSCNCGKQENSIKGYITVVGNEPFTKLALRTENDKVFLLNCSKELESLLLKDQGNFYYITYNNIKEQEGTTIISVEKVVPIKTESKTN